MIPDGFSQPDKCQKFFDFLLTLSTYFSINSAWWDQNPARFLGCMTNSFPVRVSPQLLQSYHEPLNCFYDFHLQLMDFENAQGDFQNFGYCLIPQSWVKLNPLLHYYFFPIIVSLMWTGMSACSTEQLTRKATSC